MAAAGPLGTDIHDARHQPGLRTRQAHRSASLGSRETAGPATTHHGAPSPRRAFSETLFWKLVPKRQLARQVLERCDPAEKDGSRVPSLGAGGHFDPNSTGVHQGPQGQGHLGDLPVLYVDAKGNATRASWAPRLKTSDLAGRAIIIHSGGDNYSDVPKKLGGGGSRVACGLVVN